MLKRLKSAGLVPALVVSAVLAASLIIPASANPFTVSTPGCGYGYPVVTAPTVANVNPNVGPASGGTSVVITGTNFCNVSAVKFGTVNAVSFVVNSRTQITAVSPAGAPGSVVDVTVTNNISTSATSAADKFTYSAVPGRMWACTRLQYHLTGSDGSTWVAIDGPGLSVDFTPTVDSIALFGGNADLWTSNTGFNQDMGISVVGGTSPMYPTTSGQPEGWKESGGYGGTFSPNAAFLQTAVPVKAGQQYAGFLTWKTNKPNPGTIYAGAGPIGGRFSQTCITVQLIDPTTISTKVTTTQNNLVNSNGTTWQNIDAVNLSASFTAPTNGTILVSGNADLWTAKAGFNQDLGLAVTGGGYPTTAGQPEAWKESGGFAGTFSPNAAYVQALLPVTGDNTYTVKLVWKTNKGGTSQIFNGAGPIGAKFSTTRVTILFFPTATSPIDKVSTQQYHLTSSDGSTWQAMDPFNLVSTVTATASCEVWVGINADLFTANAGFNQDIGIAVADTTLPSFPNQPEGWKESGGFNGTFSPNAAFNRSVVTLAAGHTYSFVVVWKANRNDPGGTIYAGAGPIGGKFSPTRLTLQAFGC